MINFILTILYIIVFIGLMINLIIIIKIDNDIKKQEGLFRAKCIGILFDNNKDD